MAFFSWEPILELRSVTCAVMGSHCHTCKRASS